MFQSYPKENGLKRREGCKAFLQKVFHHPGYLLFIILQSLISTPISGKSQSVPDYSLPLRVEISEATMQSLSSVAFKLQPQTGETDLQKNYKSIFTDKRTTLSEFIALINKNQNDFITGFHGPSLSNKKLWFSVLIEYDGDDHAEFVFESRTAVHKLSIYKIVNNHLVDVQSFGVHRENTSRNFIYRYPAFLAKMNPGSNLFIFEIEANAYHSSLYLWNKDAFQDYLVKDAIVISGLISALFIIVLYSVMQFIITKDLATSYYICYIVGFLLYQSYIQGFGSYIFGQGSKYALFKAPLYFTTIIYFGMVGFAVQFLRLYQHKRILVHLFIALNIVLFLSAIASHWHYALAGKIHAIIFTITIPVVIYFSYISFRNGHKSAGYYLLSWIFMGAGVGVYCLTLLSVLPYTSFTTRLSFLISAVIEVLFMSLAISDESRRFVTGKNEELALALRRNEHAFSEMAKMVYPHQLTKIRSGHVLESTMPTVTAQACVLSFDIVGSSKIHHINAKEFFRNTFQRCNEIISEGYDGETLRSAAYRIKEMGDGFLCSVGYPFKALSKNPANDSVDLAKKFAIILREESEMLHSETPIACGIGVALDSLTGFYPETGTKEYDIYGPALILATRYEGMRKIIYPEGNKSILIIQEKVYHSLDPSHRNGFIELNLRQQGIGVRDDPAAEHIYYQFLDELQANIPVQPSRLQVV